MNPETMNDLFSKAWHNQCDALCVDHKGKCKVVSVRCNNVDWWFSYCDAAIETDKRRGLAVTVHNAIQMSPVEDTRTPAQKAKDELGFPIEEQGR
jgi:hypothetical protein